MSNRISKEARKYFLHTADTCHRTEEKSAYFSQRGYDDSGWGMWIEADGVVTIDDESANGERPSARIVAICKIAARKLLVRKDSDNSLA